MAAMTGQDSGVLWLVAVLLLLTLGLAGALLAAARADGVHPGPQRQAPRTRRTP